MTHRVTYGIGLSIALMCVCATLATAQGVDVRGVVSDSVTGQRIPLVDVVVLNTSRGASTNTSGFFLVTNIPPGKYQIVASVIGYRRKTELVELQTGKPVTLSFQLAAIPVETQEVLVTSTRRHELAEVSSSVHTMERNDVKLVPSVVQEDIFQSLKMLPGIVSTNDVSARFFARGGAADQNLVLLDGLKIISPFHAMGIFSVLDPDVVQSVEVSTGAFPSEYGGRLSSVVNIVTRDGRSDRLSGRANLNFLSAKLQLEGPALPGTTWMLDVRKSVFSDAFKRLVNQDVPVSFYDAFGKFGFLLPSGGKVDFSILSSSDKLNLFQTYKYLGRTLTSSINYLWQTTAARVSYSTLVGDRVFTEYSVYYSSYQAHRDSAFSKTPSSTVNTVQEFGLRSLATYYTSSRDLCKFGFEFTFPKVYYSLTNPSGRPLKFDDAYVDAAAWFRYQVHMDRWLLDVGVHEDFGSLLSGDLGLESLQPRIEVKYDAIGNWKVKGAFGLTSQRVIALINEDEVMSIFDTWIKIPSAFPAERAAHFVLGMNGNISETTSLNVETYYKRYSSLVVYNRNKMFDSDPDYITGWGKSYGFEALVRSRLWEIDLYAAYTLGWTWINDGTFEYPPQYDRRHSLNLMATMHPLRNLEVSFRWDIGSGLPFTANLGYYNRLMLGGPSSTPFQLETGPPYLAMGEKNAWHLPTYHRLDANITYRIVFGGLTGTIGAQVINLYDNINVFYFNRYTGDHTDMLRFFPSVSGSVSF